MVSQIFPAVSQENSRNSLYYYHQNISNIALRPFPYLDKLIAASQNVFARPARSDRLRPSFWV